MQSQASNYRHWRQRKYHLTWFKRIGFIQSLSTTAYCDDAGAESLTNKFVKWRIVQCTSRSEQEVVKDVFRDIDDYCSRSSAKLLKSSFFFIFLF